MSSDMIIDPTLRRIQCGDQYVLIDAVSNVVRDVIDSPVESPAWPALEQRVLVFAAQYETWVIARLLWGSCGELEWRAEGILAGGWVLPFAEDQYWQSLPPAPEGRADA